MYIYIYIYPVFPSFCRIQAVKENPLLPTSGAMFEGTVILDAVNENAVAELPDLPGAVTTPLPRIPFAVILKGAGELDAKGHVPLQTAELQFGARDAVALVE